MGRVAERAVMSHWVILVGMMLLAWGGGSSTAGTSIGDHDQKGGAEMEYCGHTRYPQLCAETLSGLGSSAAGKRQQVSVLSAHVNKTISETGQLPVSSFAKLSYHFISLEAQRARMATGDCEELMKMSLKRLNQALSALEDISKNSEDIKTWLSAALTYQQNCKDSAEANAISNEEMARIGKKMDHLSRLTSNSLALVNRITKNSNKETTSTSIRKGRGLGEKTASFPSWVSSGDRRILQGGTVKPNVVVAKDGSGNYETVTEAINAASGGRFVIFVKAGVYREKIKADKDGITLVGEGKYATIISGDDSHSGGSSLRGTATFSITGDGFIAMNIGFQNAAGPGAGQAIAITVSSDRSVFFRCSISGFQDSLYAHSLRQFYRECDIHGTVDFIFGNAAAVLQSCNIALRNPGSGASYDVVMANGRTDPGQNTGFSLQNCRITAASDYSASGKSYLGRPWKEYSRAVVMQSTIDGVISPRGWVEWPGSSGSSLKNLYFAEYANIGARAGTSGRVRWPGFHLIGKEEANKFTVANLISGTSWIPSTGVSFVSGL